MSYSDNVSGPIIGDWVPECPACESINIARNFSQWGECLDCGSEVDCQPPQPDPDDDDRGR